MIVNNNRSIFASNINQNKVAFKSRLVPTQYLEKGFDTAISMGFEGRLFLKSVKAILNDGLNDEIRINKVGRSRDLLNPGPKFNLFVNRKKIISDGSFYGVHSEGEQCVRAIVEYASKYKLGTSTVEDNLANAQNLLHKEVLAGRISTINAVKINDELLAVQKYFAANIKKEIEQIKINLFKIK